MEDKRLIIDYVSSNKEIEFAPHIQVPTLPPVDSNPSAVEPPAPSLSDGASATTPGQK